MNKYTLLNKILDERHKQDLKWGEQNHEPHKWCVILGEEFGEVNQSALEYSNNFTGKKLPKKYEKQHLLNYEKELIQVAAVALSALESLYRNELKINKKKFKKNLTFIR